MSSYTPISCAVHDELLALATLRRECELTVDPGLGKLEVIRGTIVDVYSRDRAEYLQLKEGRTIRLDQIYMIDGQRVAGAESGLRVWPRVF